jgi:RNA polymerase sigma-70 factor (sigma-E family)
MRAITRGVEFTAFVETNRPALVRLGLLLTAGDEARGEDLVQIALTKLYLAWPKVAAVDNQLRYAQRAVINTFIDDGRRGYRRESSTEEYLDSAVSRQPDHELRAVVLAALAELPPRQRAVVVLRHWLDQDVKTTAAVLSCSTGTVKSQNAKALQHLRSRLHELEPVAVITP